MTELVRQFMRDRRWYPFGTLLSVLGPSIMPEVAYRWGESDHAKYNTNCDTYQLISYGRRACLRAVLRSVCEWRGGRGFDKQYRLRADQLTPSGQVIDGRSRMSRGFKAWRAALTPAAKAALAEHHRQVALARWATYSPEKFQAEVMRLRQGSTRWREGLSPEQIATLRQQHQAQTAATWAKLTPEQRQARAEKVRMAYLSKTPEQQQAHGEKVRAAWANMSPEQRQAYAETHRTLWAKRTPEQRRQHGEKVRAAWAKLTPEQRQARIEKARAGRRNKVAQTE